MLRLVFLYQSIQKVKCYGRKEIRLIQIFEGNFFYSPSEPRQLAGDSPLALVKHFQGTSRDLRRNVF